jgi:hypothetical protein
MDFGGLLSALGLIGKSFLGGVILLLGFLLSVLVFGYQASTGIVTFLAETWILQTLFAAWVAFQLQEIAQSASRKRDRLQATYDRKVESTKALFRLIEVRAYASLRYLDVIESEPGKIAQERDQYRSAVAKWNEEAQANQITILLEFPSYYGLLVDNAFNPAFARIDALLRRQRLAVQSPSKHDRSISLEIRHELAELNKLSLNTVRKMLKNARRDRNIVDERVAISEDNLPHLTYARLLKALFEPVA